MIVLKTLFVIGCVCLVIGLFVGCEYQWTQYRDSLIVSK